MMNAMFEQSEGHNPYAGIYYLSQRMDEIRAGDGSTIADTAVEQLVQAMASLTPPAAGQLTLTQDLRDQLTPTLAATWQH